MKLWEKSKQLNSFRLALLLKESESEFQYLAAAYPNELRQKPLMSFWLRLYVVVLGFGKTNTFVLLKL